MASAQENRLCSYRKFLIDLSSHLSRKDLEALKFAVIELIPRRILEDISSGLKFFDVLEQDGRIAPRDLSLLVEMFETVGRMDLALKVQCFSTSSANNDIDVTDGGGNKSKSDGAASRNRIMVPGMESIDEVTDGGGNKSKSDSASSGNRIMVPGMESIDVADIIAGDIDDVVADGDGKESENSHAGIRMVKHTVKSEGPSLLGRGPALAVSAPAPAPAPAVVKYSQAGQGQQSRLQHDSSAGAPPVRYVNYLAYQGYSVEIIGGKHFKTPEGEFVEMKSGTQYQIHVKNSRAYGCNLDISIDGYDVGGWVVDGEQELTIERPAYEAKKFTFYRVKTAPKEAGIESGRSENGVVKCVFTPEALMNIPVVIPRLPQPVEVNMAPNATVGDLKCELQSQLNATQSPDQILILNDKVLSNFTRLSSMVKSPGNLTLIDMELEITVEASSSVTFAVKIQPDKAKVFDLMNLIQRKLDVAIKDQKLYHGKDRISDTPGRALPPKLICSEQPTVVLIVPEYILITIEDLRSGESRILKINKEETLRDLVEEMPLSENEEAMFYFNEKELCPSRDDGTLTSLGIASGSKLELKVKIIYIEINVTGYPGSVPTRSVSIRCNPQETFKDLLRKLEARGNAKKLEGATFATEKRVFDPEQDQGSLQDYGIKHGSALVMKVAAPELEEDSRRVKENIAASPKGKTAKKNKSFLERIIRRRKCEFGVADSEERDELPQLLPQLRPMTLTHSEELDELTPRFDMTSYMNLEKEEEEEEESGAAGSGTVQVGGARVLNKNDPAWKAGGTTLQGYSTQQFVAADPIKVDHSKKIELVLRLVAREDETDLVFPKDEFQPLSTLYPPAVPE